MGLAVTVIVVDARYAHAWSLDESKPHMPETKSSGAPLSQPNSQPSSQAESSTAEQAVRSKSQPSFIQVVAQRLSVRECARLIAACWLPDVKYRKVPDVNPPGTHMPSASLASVHAATEKGSAPPP